VVGEVFGTWLGVFSPSLGSPCCIPGQPHLFEIQTGVKIVLGGRILSAMALGFSNTLSNIK
jgi:hypothetical protein